MRKIGLVKTMGCVAGAGLALLLAGCVTNEVTGRSQFIAISDGELAQLSANAWTETKQKTPISNDVTAQARVKRVGLRIADAAGLANQPWEFVVFDTPERNAFVLPGGKVGVYKGLLDLTDNDDQLAAVLGHEVGHVTGRHALERASQTTYTQLGLAVGQAAGAQLGVPPQAGALLGLGAQYGVLLPYSRLHESEADRIGVDYMVKAGYRAGESVHFWEKMLAAEQGPRPPQILSTHPDPTNRITALKTYIASKGY